jgi:polysaccharide deacetylase 2 family uncharacterized protein YibQ
LTKAPAGQGGRRRGRRDKTTPKRRRYRSNPKRQALLALIALAAIIGGYGIGMMFTQPPPPATPPADDREASKAWYLDQPPPPAMVRTPSLPILPEGTDMSAPERAYEEPLPEEIYEPDAVPAVDAAPTAPRPAARSGEDEASWRRFAVAAADPGDRPMIAVVIDDMGVDRQRTARVVALGAPLTVAFLTYAHDLPAQTAKARAAGHELLLHVPMEPGGSNVDPGPNVLLRDIESDELQRRIEWNLSRFDGYVGINNHMGSKFTADGPSMAILMLELKRRRLLFLDSRTTGATLGPAMARRFGVPLVQRNVFLDNDNRVDAVRRRLQETERLARRRGMAVAIGHPRDATIEALAAWLPTVESRGFVLVPLSAVLRHRRAAG